MQLRPQVDCGFIVGLLLIRILEVDGQRDRQAGRQSDRDRETKTDGERQRHRETETDRQRERETGRHREIISDNYYTRIKI